MALGLLPQSPAASRSQSNETDTAPPVNWLVSSLNSKYETALPTAGQTLAVGQAALFDQTLVVFPVPPEARIEVALGALAVAVETCDDFVENATFVFAVTAPTATFSRVH